MDLLAEIVKHRRDIEEAQKLPATARAIQIEGWKNHVALECLCTAYQDQMARPEVRAAYDELMGME